MTSINLGQLLPGETAIISEIQAEEGLQQRLRALGFRTSRQVQMIRRAAFLGPLHVRVGTTEVMLRHNDAKGIKITRTIAGEIK
ncbi:iron transporter [Oscillatoriales cyanobacterium USR001]|nr:iron transporter [Oscillatoriales cyanobacterium USR001]